MPDGGRILNIQIFGKSKCFDTKKAERWFKERRIKFQSIDLIRFGKFTSGTFLWPYKGGDSFAGQGFPEYKKLFAIPASQLRANPNLHNPEGY